MKYCFVFVILLLSIVSPVRGENDQNVVILYGAGYFSFSDEDELRPDESDTNKTLLTAYQSIEWYLFEELGVGFLYLASLDLFSFSSEADKVEASNYFLTLNYILIGAEDYVRIGTMAGYGRSDYRYKIKGEADNRDERLADFRRGSTEGSASCFGIFLDLGGDRFGVRLSLHAVETNLENFETPNATYEVDGSGTNVGFLLRVAI